MEGHDQKKISGALRRIGAPTFAPDQCPNPHIQIRSGATASTLVCFCLSDWSHN